MEEFFKCSICGNSDKASIGFLNGKPYCRKCISFKRTEIIKKQSLPSEGEIYLEYDLSPEQKALSLRLVTNYKRGIDSMVYAVCGSGKTEISLGVIQYALNCGEKVAFAVPRKDVVIELHSRLENIFKNNTVIALYGGHTEVVNGDIIVLTTHQLFRYVNFFSLIVLDEIDAFPFKGNEVLNHLFFNALTESGHYVMMSATPTKEALKLFSSKNKEILRLDTRFHGHPLPVPQIVIHKKVINYVVLCKKLYKCIRDNKPVFVFAPTIEKCEKLYRFIGLFFLSCNFVHSKKADRKQVIEDFKKKKFKILVTTSVLERGVTLENLQVIVFDADHKIYDSGTLVQIAGRVGRKIKAPTGDVYFLAGRLTKEMQDAVKSIKQSNSHM